MHLTNRLIAGVRGAGVDALVALAEDQPDHAVRHQQRDGLASERAVDLETLHQHGRGDQLHLKTAVHASVCSGQYAAWTGANTHEQTRTHAGTRARARNTARCTRRCYLRGLGEEALVRLLVVEDLVSLLVLRAALCPLLLLSLATR